MFIICFDIFVGVSYVVLVLENELVDSFIIVEYKGMVEVFCKEVVCFSMIECISDDRFKWGVFIGSYVINFLIGVVLLVWIVDYVLVEYGMGVVMGVLVYD